MTTNLVDLRAKIFQLQKDFVELGYELREKSMNIKIIELDGNEQWMEKYPEFQEEFNKYLKIAQEISRLKGIVFERNNSLKLKNGDTIQKAVSDIATKKKVLELVKKFARQTPSKSRTSETTNSYFTSNELAYDKENMIALQQELIKEIQDTELEISQLNAETFEI